MNLVSPLNPPLPTANGDKINWGSLYGSSMCLAIANAANNSQQPLLVITPDNLASSQLEEELSFFTPLKIMVFPDWETLPYDTFSPHQDLISQRLAVLSTLPTLNNGIVIVSVQTLMQKIAPNNYIEASSFALSTGEKINLSEMRIRFERCGYQCVAQVLSPGEFAVRGSLLDVFPMGSNSPFRIDLFDNEVDSIRTFDPENQRSLEKIAKISLLPAREFPLTEQAISLFRQAWRNYFPGNPLRSPIYQNVSDGNSTPGIEYYLPLFFEQTATLFDYLSPDCTIIRCGDVTTPADKFWDEIRERYEQRRYDQSHPLLPPTEIFLTASDLFAKTHQFKQIQCQQDPVTEKLGAYNFATQTPPVCLINHKSEHPLHELKAFLTKTNNRILFCAESAGRREALLELLKQGEIYPHITATWSEFLQQSASPCLSVAPLEQGLSLTDPSIIVFAETQLFGAQVLQQRRRKQRFVDSDIIVRNLAELQIGAAVVHIDHGVGRYVGLQILHVNNYEAEYLTLEYDGGDKLYVPVASLHYISRYSGTDVENAPLNRLGTDQWQKAKQKAQVQIRDVAAELLDIYAIREARPGFQYPTPDEQYRAFSAAFPFEETPDQTQAIAQVVNDMTSGKPMDRLICGDVGFGKTEVAMRAAFVAVQAGKQVAILVPTTLLAQQHYQNFSDRFADWPIKIEMLSRFRSTTEQTNILSQVKEGKIDIIIGTHKLLQPDIQFHALGLVIIDEEHRFGVRQKERLKTLRAEVDVLTLTATPIPRTLNMALADIRDLSLIATPPARRLAIKTFVHPRSDIIIREAILREIMRGGQVYFLHNAVETIQRIAEELKELVPEARIAIAHGQMRERELEHVMSDFYHHRFNVLVCTTIIETGIDIPAANTIIMDRADKFGLAQLHQLRGRVGRSHHQAYAYLLTPIHQKITPDAEKRLDAITALEELGSGFTLATHDLEIRGAGELLGEEQSGNIQAVGFSLYMELLDRAVHALKEGKEPDLEKPLHVGAEIDLQIPALIPNDYVPDVHTRLVLYKRIANAQDEKELDELQVEFIDRFGLLPDAAKNLFRLTALKIHAKPLGIRKVDANIASSRIEFVPNPPINPVKIILLIQQEPDKYKLDGPDRLRCIVDQQKPEDRFNNLEKLFRLLS